MADQFSKSLSGELVEEGAELTFEQLCRRCSVTAEEIVVFVEEGLIEPIMGTESEWRFSGVGIMRVKRAHRLQRDLRLNPSGAALALELMDEIERLRARLHKLERG